jgi:AraC family transcriptional regulator
MELQKIQHIVKYIEENYHRTIPIEILEDIGCYSYRNLHRVFQNLFKESLGAFQKRLKLENGYKKLIYTNDTVTDIAYFVGFESLQAFTKSFKKQFKISPSDARLHKLNIFNDYINQLTENESIFYEIVYLNPLKIFYQSIKTSNYKHSDIENQWDKIDDLYGKQKDVAYYGIIVDQPLITSEKHCRYEACINQEPHNKALMSKEIFGGKYAKYIHKGQYESIEDTYRLIYKDWFFRSKLEFDNSSVIEHYVVHNYNTEHEEEFLTEILFPLKKA